MRIVRLLLAVMAVLALVVAPMGVVLADGGPAAGTIRIQVRGRAQIDAVALMGAESFQVRGELVDDAGAPIPAALVTIQAFAVDEPGRPLILPSPVDCSLGGRPRGSIRRPAPEQYVVETDPRGGFCVKGQGTLVKATVRLRFQGGKLYEPVSRDVAVDAAQQQLAQVRLRFETPIDTIDLDREAISVVASLRVERKAASFLPDARREGLTLLLEDERGEQLGEAVTGGDGRARFDVKTVSLGDPGAGELRVRFDATAMLARASAAQAVMRTAEVRLAAGAGPAEGDPEDGIVVDVDVSSSRGPVSAGVVEALRGVESVGAGTVASGKARVVVSFASERAENVPLRLRYVPSAPWWRAGPEIGIEVRVVGPGIAKQVLFAILVIAVAVWVVVGWRRAPKRVVRRDGESSLGPPSGRAGVQVIAASPAHSGWRGTVSDAHEGVAIAGARLRIVVPSFQGDGIVADATTDARGEFTLQTAHRSDARLIVESVAHSRYEQPLPPPSVLSVALVARRRAILDQLVRWARRQGSPFDGPPEPTPGHVRRVAARVNASDTEAWARRVEHVAFGPDAVDEKIEKEIRTAEPAARR